MECITVLLIILTILIICSLFSIDHFKPINSLNIKYNAKNVRIPNQLEKPSKIELSLREKINAELKNSPLVWENQMYSIPNYSYVGPKTPCKSDSHCAITAECNHDSNVFDREHGVGVCTVRVPDKTVFDISF
jgi:hypothetical protein